MLEMMERTMTQLAFIGFGEVGTRFAADLRMRGGIRVAAFDIRLSDPERGAKMRQQAESTGVTLAASPADAARGAAVVFSAVTASQTVVAAEVARGYLLPGQIFFDINSAAPGTKRRAAAAVHPSGAQYVEGAVMAAVGGPGIAVPILAGGAAAVALSERLNAIGFAMQPVAEEIGRASAMKLCRSIVIKGLEALMVDCAAASRVAGVEAEVYASLAGTYPAIDWAKLAVTMGERVATHGIRRSEEMAEAAEMLRDIGVDPTLAAAVAAAQRRGAKR